MPRAAVPVTKITILQPTHIKRKVERAAAMRGMSLTSYINGILESTADGDIERTEKRDLSERDSALLLDMLRGPKGPNRTLRAAAAEYRERFGGR